MADDRGPEIGSAEAAKRMAVLRPHLVDGVPLTRVAADAGIPIRTPRRWIARYRSDGPAGLARPPRPEAGKRTFPEELVQLIEGMALLKGAVHRTGPDIRLGARPPERHGLVDSAPAAVGSLMSDRGQPLATFGTF